MPNYNSTYSPRIPKAAKRTAMVSFTVEELLCTANALEDLHAALQEPQATRLSTYPEAQVEKLHTIIRDKCVNAAISMETAVEVEGDE